MLIQGPAARPAQQGCTECLPCAGHCAEWGQQASFARVGFTLEFWVEGKGQELHGLTLW